MFVNLFMTLCILASVVYALSLILTSGFTSIGFCGMDFSAFFTVWAGEMQHLGGDLHARGHGI